MPNTTFTKSIPSVPERSARQIQFSEKSTRRINALYNKALAKVTKQMLIGIALCNLIITVVVFWLYNPFQSDLVIFSTGIGFTALNILAYAITRHVLIQQHNAWSLRTSTIYITLKQPKLFTRKLKNQPHTPSAKKGNHTSSTLKPTK